MAAKTKDKGNTVRDLGKAGGVEDARKNGKGKGGKGETFMHEARDEDAQEAKLGQAASMVKDCHLLAKEAVTRLTAARLATSTHAAIEHDLERVVELADDVKAAAKDALKALAR